MGHRYATPPTCSSGWRCRRIGEVAEFAMSRPGGAVTVRAARNASRPRATVPGTKPPGIRAREGHLQSATHSCVTYGPYVTQNRKEGPHMSTKSMVPSTRNSSVPAWLYGRTSYLYLRPAVPAPQAVAWSLAGIAETDRAAPKPKEECGP